MELMLGQFFIVKENLVLLMFVGLFHVAILF